VEEGMEGLRPAAVEEIGGITVEEGEAGDGAEAEGVWADRR